MTEGEDKGRGKLKGNSKMTEGSKKPIEDNGKSISNVDKLIKEFKGFKKSYSSSRNKKRIMRS